MSRKDNNHGSNVGSLWFSLALDLKTGVKGAGSLTTRRLALAATLSALAVALSPMYFPIADTKCFPAQHMVNALAGILLGPWYAVLVAVVVGTVRIGLGLGTFFAYPGGIFGGLIVGLLWRYVKKSDYVALLEPLGTVVVGATVSALIVAPMLGKTMTLAYFWTAFAASSIPGAIIGFLVLKAVRRIGFDRYFN